MNDESCEDLREGRCHACLQALSGTETHPRGLTGALRRLGRGERGHGEAEGMGGLEVDHQRQAGAAFVAPLRLDGREESYAFRGSRSMSSFEEKSDSVLTRSWKFISWRAPWGLFACAHTKHRRVRSVPESRKLRKISSCPRATGGSSVSCIPSRAKRSRLAPGWPGGFSLHPAVNCVSEQRSADPDR
jgi:hypothetical protein